MDVWQSVYVQCCKVHRHVHLNWTEGRVRRRIRRMPRQRNHKIRYQVMSWNTPTEVLSLSPVREMSSFVIERFTSPVCVLFLFLTAKISLVLFSARKSIPARLFWRGCTRRYDFVEGSGVWSFDRCVNGRLATSRRPQEERYRSDTFFILPAK